MILGDPRETAAAVTPGTRTTLDDLFHRAAQHSPDMLALAECLHRQDGKHGKCKRRQQAAWYAFKSR